ncbi:transcription termination/antitermination protein NusG [Tranquillimonas rosea]|uniref:transcription termination/antitermination protein NusG n=1 Tax=Tranquillimonas rosea TaxID=641238 RepID=UPI003BA97492
MTPDNWFVAQLKPNGLNEARRNLDRQRFRSFVPKRQETRRQRGKLVSKDVSLFPGYIFVRFDPEQPGWIAINNTRGITRLVLPRPNRPTPLPRQLMAGLMARCDENEHLAAASAFQEGDEVRVVSGPFANYVTKIEKIEDGDRLRLLFDIMGQLTKVTVPSVDVERLAS